LNSLQQLQPPKQTETVPYEKRVVGMFFCSPTGGCNAWAQERMNHTQTLWTLWCLRVSGFA
jgi:hypothetical protein